MIKFIGYVVKYKANTHKLARLEEELDYYKTALQLEEKKSNDKNNALRQINTLLSEYEKRRTNKNATIQRNQNNSG